MKAYLYALTRRIHRLVFTADPVRFFVISLFALILGLVALAIFVISREFFAFLSQFPAVFNPLSLYIFQTTLLGIYIFAVGSYTFLFYQRFKAKENIIFKLASSRPTRPCIKSELSIILKSLFETGILGSWTIISLIIPALLGFNSTVGVSMFLLIKQFIGFFLYIFLALIPAVFIVLVLGSFKSVKTRKFLLITISLLLILVSFFLTRIFIPERLVYIAAQPEVEKVIVQLEKLPVSYMLLPPAQLAKILVNGTGLSSFFGLASIIGITFFILTKKFFHSTWQRFQEGVFIADPRQSVGRKSVFPFPVHFTVLYKDILQLFRIPSQAGYFIFILFITLVYSAIIAQAPAYSSSLPFYKTTIRLCLLLIPGYLLLTLLMQFVFPSLRQEIERFFLFSGISNRWSRLIKEKLTFAVFLAVLFSLFSVLSTTIFFNTHLASIPEYAAFILIGSIILTSIVFTVGGSFTKFLKSEFNDQSTNVPGLFATGSGIVLIAATSLLYLGCGLLTIFVLLILAVLSIITSFVIIRWIINSVDLL